MDTYAFQAKLTRINPVGLTVRGLRSTLGSPVAAPRGGSPDALSKKLTTYSSARTAWPSSMPAS